MIAKQDALVEPELLKWARESIGYEIDEAAKKIGVKPERVLGWESKESRPSIAQLRKIADVYKRPLAIFYLPSPPEEFQPMKDFRHFPGAKKIPSSPNFLYLLRKVHQRREVILELKEYFDYGNVDFIGTVKLSDDVVLLGKKIRKNLNISLEEQIQWSDKYAALNAWKLAIENLGVIIFQNSNVASGEYRGFSISEKQCPIIIINANDSPRARVFTLLHEFAHLLLNTGGICDLHENPKGKSATERVEIFCNRVAGEVLVPEFALVKHELVNSVKNFKEWSDDEIWELAKYFSVSTEVIIRRLLIMGLATYEFYQQKRREYKEKEERFKKEQKEKQKAAEKKGFISPATLALRDLGKPYTSVIIEAYHNEAISASAVSEYLDVKLKHLPKIQASLAIRK